MKTQFQQLDDEILIFETEKTDEMLIQKEKISIIKEFMDTLRSPDKDILKAYYFWNYKLEYIAVMYELPLSTVKSKIYRGRKAITEYFEELYL
jgi:RNA polymerase sigma-70 factor (ECF subfamily)